jgi:hypothetical protein
MSVIVRLLWQKIKDVLSLVSRVTKLSSVKSQEYFVTDKIQQILHTKNISSDDDILKCHSCFGTIGTDEISQASLKGDLVENLEGILRGMG